MFFEYLTQKLLNVAKVKILQNFKVMPWFSYLFDMFSGLLGGSHTYTWPNNRLSLRSPSLLVLEPRKIPAVASELVLNLDLFSTAGYVRTISFYGRTLQVWSFRWVAPSTPWILAYNKWTDFLTQSFLCTDYSSYCNTR